MEIIKLTGKNQASIIKQAVAVLKQGGTIIYPTETAYGLGADFLNPLAVKKVYQIKGRDFKKPLSVIVGSLPMAKKLVVFDKLSLILAKKHWPGPLTLVQSSKLKTNNLKPQTLALRVSSNKLATAIVKKLKSPLTATSANLAGKGEIYSIKEIVKQFGKKKYQPDLIIDGGILPKVKPSTIAKVSNGKIEILRKGKIEIFSSQKL
ncbi:MAG: L-threonylcarbamoyladenylate synthase [Patescibacteria group bacterium]|jgi:L-threonylcarbamoyladenylate synthase